MSDLGLTRVHTSILEVVIYLEGQRENGFLTP